MGAGGAGQADLMEAAEIGRPGAASPTIGGNHPMTKLHIRRNALGFEILDGEELAALYRATEELPRSESPKPCFAPIYTPAGGLVTEYRPADHPWHTGLYFGWVFANGANLWGGPWYLPEKDRYELIEGTHGVQRHDRFTLIDQENGGVVAEERLSWLDAEDGVMAAETRSYRVRKVSDPLAYHWDVRTWIEPVGGPLRLGASRKSHYSGFELRTGPPFAGDRHLSSEGAEGHESIMKQRARWVSAAGAAGGAVVMMDHPDNPRHPVTWFTRRNLLGAGLLMSGDLEIEEGDVLNLRYGFAALAEEPAAAEVEAFYAAFAS
jgi:hypothetical protein